MPAITLCVKLVFTSMPESGNLRHMEVSFEEEAYDQLETDPRFTGGFAANVVSAYRKRMQQIRAALDERDLYKSGGLHFEKLKGNRSHQHSMRLNEKWRLIIELRGKGQDKQLHIVEISNHYD